jgi:allantoin racemase
LTVKYGLGDRCAAVERIDTPSMQAFTEGFLDPSKVLADMENKARKLVDRGANAIVIASAGLSTIAAYGGLTQLKDLGVPIFDALTAGLKTLEMRVDLTQRGGLPPVSRTGMFERYSDSEAGRVRYQMGYQDAVATSV